MEVKGLMSLNKYLTTTKVRSNFRLNLDILYSMEFFVDINKTIARKIKHGNPNTRLGR